MNNNNFEYSEDLFRNAKTVEALAVKPNEVIKVIITNAKFLGKEGRILINVSTLHGKKIKQVASFNLKSEDGFQYALEFLGDMVGADVDPTTALGMLKGKQCKCVGRLNNEYVNIQLYSETQSIQVESVSTEERLDF